MNKKIRGILAAAAISTLALTGCSSGADVAGENLRRAADEFEINRRVVFVNGITNDYLLTIEGRCSITDQGHQLEVLCRTGENEYKKHFLGLSDNMTYFAEQMEAAEASSFHYRVVFRPEVILPELDIITSDTP